MSKKDKKKREADGIWVSDERRITEECRQVYPALYKLQKAVLGVTMVVWLITLLGPTLLKKLAAGYGSWGNTFETVTLVLAFVFLHEKFNTKSLIGCILIGAGTLVMVL